MNLKKLNLGLVALVLGFGLVITQSAFKSPQKAAPVTYQYTSNSSSEADMIDINNWSVVEDESPNCASGSAKPCRYIYDGDFETFLLGTTKVDLLSNAISLKQ